MGNYGLSKFSAIRIAILGGWRKHRFSVMQSQLRAGTVNAATLFADLGREREMKMQGQEEDKQQ